MTTPKHPLAEVFGYPIADFSEEAQRSRTHRLCPFNNKGPNCTKASAEDPIGVCSVFHGNEIAITCPIRFRENWQIATDAAAFFFEPGVPWTALPEVRLNDAYGRSAGNIDLVLKAFDEIGRVTGIGAVVTLIHAVAPRQRDDRRAWDEVPLQRLLSPFIRGRRRVFVATDKSIPTGIEKVDQSEASVAWGQYAISGPKQRPTLVGITFSHYPMEWQSCSIEAMTVDKLLQLPYNEILPIC